MLILSSKQTFHLDCLYSSQSLSHAFDTKINDEEQFYNNSLCKVKKMGESKHKIQNQ